MYTVIYSTDPYLLARMATDLQMVGWRKSKCNLDRFHPFSGRDKETKGNPYCKWMVCYEDKIFSLNNHYPDYFKHTRHTLTSRNYLKVLGAILNSKK